MKRTSAVVLAAATVLSIATRSPATTTTITTTTSTTTTTLAPLAAFQSSLATLTDEVNALSNAKFKNLLLKNLARVKANTDAAARLIAEGRSPNGVLRRTNHVLILFAHRLKLQSAKRALTPTERATLLATMTQMHQELQAARTTSTVTHHHRHHR